MKKIFTLCLAMLLVLTCSAGVFAMEVPSEVTVQNLNGVQQYIKTYTVSPDVDPASLIEEDFTYEGFDYTYSRMVKTENLFKNEEEHSEVITAETAKKDLSVILEALPAAVDYDKDGYNGILYLDHTTINTEPAGYASRSYTVSETREIPNLDDCDMSYVPQTVQKDGKTLQLAGCDWQVQGTAVVDDILVPSSFKAVATYSAKASSSFATGYITTATYTGKVSCSDIQSITYTLTYTGSVHEDEPEAVTEDSGYGIFSSRNSAIICGIVFLALLIALIVAVLEVIRCDKRLDHAFDYDQDDRNSGAGADKDPAQEDDINLTEDDLAALLNEPGNGKGDENECEKERYF